MDRSLVRGSDLASAQLLEKMRGKNRTIVIATQGTEDLRYLDFMGANANVGGENLTHIILREQPRVIELWEEFLHGTQQKCRLIQKHGVPRCEIHVKRFMIRHRKIIGISEADISFLERLIENLEGPRDA